jgi:hypothetical protein
VSSFDKAYLQKGEDRQVDVLESGAANLPAASDALDRHAADYAFTQR